MQIKPIIYENLTTNQRIIATIEAEARNDEEEVARLIKSCPKKNYRQTDTEYSDKMENLMYVAMGVECEINRNALVYMTALYLDYAPMEKCLQNIIDIKTAWQETLKSMDIDPNLMKKASPIKPMSMEIVEELLPNPLPDNVAMIATEMKKFFT